MLAQSTAAGTQSLGRLSQGGKPPLVEGRGATGALGAKAPANNHAGPEGNGKCCAQQAGLRKAAIHNSSKPVVVQAAISEENI